MYSRCLFCTADLGRNEVVERFPVGRRLAYDAAKGRLWVVCRKCERWNLTPLEERWEAIEEAERLFSGTKLRVATDNVGLARIAEGTELVRIGKPLRPEFAAWRYGDQFRRRWRRHLVASGVGSAASLGYWLGSNALMGAMAGAVLGVVALPALAWPIWHELHRSRRGVARVRAGDGRVLALTDQHVRETRVLSVPGTSDDLASLEVEVPSLDRCVPPWRSLGGATMSTRLTGDVAAVALSTIVPRLNGVGGRRHEIEGALGIVDRAPSALAVLRQVSRQEQSSHALSRGALGAAHVPLTLALEMILHEDDERRALEGELLTLEARWRGAEEIAAIADSLFLPPGVEERVPAR